MNNPWAHLFLFVAMTTATDTVEIQNENLLMTRPDGYKMDFYEKPTICSSAKWCRLTKVRTTGRKW
jgi:hypothetical protein